MFFIDSHHEFEDICQKESMACVDDKNCNGIGGSTMQGMAISSSFETTLKVCVFQFDFFLLFRRKCLLKTVADTGPSLER